VEGTLSLLDWRPTPAPQEAPVVEKPVQPSQGIEHRIVVFDCETTGTDRVHDQVIELCVQMGIGDDAPSRVWRIKPAVPIHPGAQAVHGISAAELADCPAFIAVADEVAAVFADADVIVGYNLAFDIDMLQAEYNRLGRAPIDWAAKLVVDPFRLWQKCEPRSLQDAHRRFVGDEFSAAHSASADVAATGRVLSGMLRNFKLEHQDWAQIASVCDPERASWLGPSRHLRWDAEIIVVGFGKYAGMPLHEIASGPDRSFLRWVLEKDFPPHVMDVCRAALEMQRDQLVDWARARFGVPAPTALPPFAAAK
jgi:DNA polymerase-3 subunit epsilon